MAGLEDSGETIEALKAKYFVSRQIRYFIEDIIVPGPPLERSRSIKVVLSIILGIIVFNIFWVLFLPAEYAYAWGESMLPYLRAISIYHVSPHLLNNSPVGVYAEFMTEWLSASWVFMSLCIVIYVVLQYKQLYMRHKIEVFYLKVAEESDIEIFKIIKIVFLFSTIVILWVLRYSLTGDRVYNDLRYYGDLIDSNPSALKLFARDVGSRLELVVSLQVHLIIVHVSLLMSVLYIYNFYLFYWIMKYLVRPFHPDLFADIDMNIRPEDREALRARMMAESANFHELGGG